MSSARIEGSFKARSDGSVCTCSRPGDNIGSVDMWTEFEGSLLVRMVLLSKSTIFFRGVEQFRCMSFRAMPYREIGKCVTSMLYEHTS